MQNTNIEGNELFSLILYLKLNTCNTLNTYRLIILL